MEREFQFLMLPQMIQIGVIQAEAELKSLVILLKSYKGE